MPSCIGMHDACHRGRDQSAGARRSASMLCGVAPAADHPELRFLREWLDRGYAGDDGVSRIAPPTSAPTSAMCCLGAHGHRHRHASTTPTARTRPSAADPARAQIARYAWGDDYHDVIGARLDALLAWMRDGRRSRSRRARTSTPDRCRSASTRSTPASAGSGRTPASSTRSSDRGFFSARSSAACRSRSTRRRSTSAARARCASKRARRRRSSAPGVLDSTRCISY